MGRWWMGTRCVTGFSRWCCLTDSSGSQVLVLLWALPAMSFLLASTGLFALKICSLSSLPPGFQGSGPSQVDRTSLCDGSCGSQLGIHPHLCCLVVLYCIHACVETYVENTCTLSVCVWLDYVATDRRSGVIIGAPII